MLAITGHSMTRLTCYWYFSAVIRSVVALHNLINNKLALKDAENEGEKVSSTPTCKYGL
jgi:hypothetical protein